MYKKKTKYFVIVAFIQILTLLLIPGVAFAEPAKCIVFNSGSDILSEGDNSDTLVDCESSEYAGLQNFTDDHYYRITVTPVSEPTVSEISAEDYARSADIIGGGTGELPGESGNFEADCQTSGGEALTTENCGIVAYVVLFTNVLSGLVGIVIVIMIAVGGIQYTTARDDPQAVSAARTRIRNAVLALVFYLVSIAFIQWLVPGGVF